MGLLSGFAKINDFEVKVLEAGVAPPIRISLDESRRTTVPRQQQAPIAASTPQQQAITKAVEKVITAINQADVSEQEKNGAKSLLRKLLGSKAAASVLGAGAQSLAAKYFTGIAAGPIRRLNCATLDFGRPREDQRDRATEAGERAVVFGLTDPSPGPPVSARQITKSPSNYSQKLCATVLRTISETDRKLTVCRAVFNSAVSLMIYRPLRRKTDGVSRTRTSHAR